MTLIDLPVGGRSADDTNDTERSPIEQRGVTWALAGAEEQASAEPQRSSSPRCSDGNGTLTHLFFSDDEFDIARAKAICGKCGLAERCLSSALERSEPYGVWGGSLVIDGVIVEVKRGRGRPPKNPRPPLVVDEVPLPPHLVA